nr:glutathione binding-like protein [Breoghania sp. L-A4]
MLPRVFNVLDAQLSQSVFLAGDTFSIAYAFVVLGWTKMQNVDLSAWANVEGYLKRIAERPSVQAVLKSGAAI